MEKRRVALFINSAYGGGAERVISILSDWLSKDYELYVFLIDNKKKFYEYSGTIVNLGGRSQRFGLNLLHACMTINHVIRKLHIEVVISFLDFPNLINTMFNHSCRKIISIRSQMDETIYSTPREHTKLVLAKRFFKRADKVISVAEEMNQSIIQEFHIEKNKCCVIYNPYDIEEINRKARCKVAEELEVFLEQHDTSLAIGRVDEQKDYELLLEIFAQVKMKHQNAGLVILGKGALEEQIERRIKELKLEQSVRLAGIQKNPFSFMHSCKIYVSASLYEGFPNALVEAMACGMPCIHSDCKTGPREILCIDSDIDEDSINYKEYGVLIPSYTRGKISKQRMKEIYVDAWVQMLESDELQKQYGKKASARAKDFSIEKCVKAYMNVIDEKCC